jgi:hypothetical protein
MEDLFLGRKRSRDDDEKKDRRPMLFLLTCLFPWLMMSKKQGDADDDHAITALSDTTGREIQLQGMFQSLLEASKNDEVKYSALKEATESMHQKFQLLDLGPFPADLILKLTEYFPNDRVFCNTIYMLNKEIYEKSKNMMWLPWPSRCFRFDNAGTRRDFLLNHNVSHIKFSADSKNIIWLQPLHSCGTRLEVWNVMQGNVQTTVLREFFAGSVLSASGNIKFAQQSQRSVNLYSMDEGELPHFDANKRQLIPLGDSSVAGATAILVSPSGSIGLFIYFDRSTAPPQHRATYSVWNLQEQNTQCIHSCSLELGAIQSKQVCSDEFVVWQTKLSRDVFLWNHSDTNPINLGDLFGSTVDSLSLNPTDPHIIAALTPHQEIQIIQFSRGVSEGSTSIDSAQVISTAFVPSLERRGFTQTRYGLRWLPDGSTLAWMSKNTWMKKWIGFSVFDIKKKTFQPLDYASCHDGAPLLLKKANEFLSSKRISSIFEFEVSPDCTAIALRVSDQDAGTYLRVISTFPHRHDLFACTSD